MNTVVGNEGQDLYCTLADPEEKLRDYKNVVELLESYFEPKINVRFERHVSGKWIRSRNHLKSSALSSALEK